jgi:hypothetical protein
MARGARAPLERARDRGQQLRAVADDRGRLAVDKVRDQVQHRGVQAQVLGRAAPATTRPERSVLSKASCQLPGTRARGPATTCPERSVLNKIAS